MSVAPAACLDPSVKEHGLLSKELSIWVQEGKSRPQKVQEEQVVQEKQSFRL